LSTFAARILDGTFTIFKVCTASGYVRSTITARLSGMLSVCIVIPSIRIATTADSGIKDIINKNPVGCTVFCACCYFFNSYIDRGSKFSTEFNFSTLTSWNCVLLSALRSNVIFAFATAKFKLVFPCRK
jgi:hypothetical protein